MEYNELLNYNNRSSNEVMEEGICKYVE